MEEAQRLPEDPHSRRRGDEADCGHGGDGREDRRRRDAEAADRAGPAPLQDREGDP